jgi:uncharacterized membrane protein
MNLRTALSNPRDRWLYLASITSGISALIHAYYIPEHWDMWPGYGWLFLLSAAAQMLLALILLAARPLHSQVIWAGILGNALLIIVWAIARTSGLPFGPMAGEIESVTWLDASCELAQALTILSLAALLRLRS